MYPLRPVLGNLLCLFVWSPNRLRLVSTMWDKIKVAREHRGPPCRVTTDPLARSAKEPLWVRHSTTREVRRWTRRTRWFLEACGLGVVVGVGLVRDVAWWGLTVGWRDVVWNEGIGGAVGLAVMPVRVSVHGGEGKLTKSQTVFISARFHFPEL